MYVQVRMRLESSVLLTNCIFLEGKHMVSRLISVEFLPERQFSNNKIFELYELSALRVKNVERLINVWWSTA